jgi:tRNA dimethylallyltransferase
LERVDPAAAVRIHPNDVRRTVRALEVFRQTGTPISALQKQWDLPIGSRVPGSGLEASPTGTRNPESGCPFLLVILDWETEALNRRINARVKQMMERGLLNELRALIDCSGGAGLAPQPAEALGYKQLLPLLAPGEPWPPRDAELEEAVERIKIETRRFGKNQRTWLRRLRTTPGCVPIACPPPPGPEAAAQILDALSHPIG